MSCYNCDGPNATEELCSCKESINCCTNCIEEYKCRVCGCLPCMFCICYEKCDQCSDIGYVCCRECDLEFRKMGCDELDVSCSKCSNMITIVRKK